MAVAATVGLTLLSIGAAVLLLAPLVLLEYLALRGWLRRLRL